LGHRDHQEKHIEEKFKLVKQNFGKERDPRVLLIIHFVCWEVFRFGSTV